ncbi:MAG: enoyl-CoA hydratase-related protein [Pseudomonadota bacterium]
MPLAPDPVTLDVSPEGLALVEINRHAHKNAIDDLTVVGLTDAFETLKGADHVRIVFLKGAGDVFSEGPDAGWLKRQSERSRDEIDSDLLSLARMLKHLHELPQFTVALVQTAAFDVSVGLIAACDWAVATQDAQFRLPDVRYASAPNALLPYLVEAMGPRTARALAASALPFEAEAALRYRLIDEIVPDAMGLEDAMKRLSGLAIENAPGAVAEAKAFARHATGHPIDDRLLKDAAKRAATQLASTEGREGLSAHLERRAPEWKK